MSSSDNALEIAKRTFSDIQGRFPHLHSSVQEGGPVELSVTLPIQPGLKYQVNLNLQSDELHLSVSNFDLEWFPCTKPDRVDDFIASVSGFLSGDYRIVEHYRSSKCLKAELQAPKDNGWKTIGVWATPGILLPWLKTNPVIVRN
jgi:hypothetical protein